MIDGAIPTAAELDGIAQPADALLQLHGLAAQLGPSVIVADSDAGYSMFAACIKIQAVKA